MYANIKYIYSEWKLSIKEPQVTQVAWFYTFELKNAPFIIMVN